MDDKRHEATIRAYLDDVFNRHNFRTLHEYMAADISSHWLGDRTLHGLPAWREAMAGFFDAFPDAAYTLNDVFFSVIRGCGAEPGELPSEAIGRVSPQRGATRRGPSSS